MSQNPGRTAAKVIAIARSEIGYHEGRSGGHWNNDEKYAADVPGLAWANYQAWCDTFVAWCFWKAGALKFLPGGATASVVQSLANARQAGRFSEYPALAAQVLYGNGEHTGLVVGYGPDTITTVEGNTNDNGSAEGDGVYLKTRQRRDGWVTGYLYPTFPEGIVSADPAYAGQAPHARHRHPAASRHAARATRVTDGRDLIEQGLEKFSDAVRLGHRGHGVSRMADRIQQALADGPKR